MIAIAWTYIALWLFGIGVTTIVVWIVLYRKR